MMWNDNGYFGHGAGWEGWLMLLFMIVFVAAVVVAVVFLVRYLAQPQGGQQPAQTALLPGSARETPREILQRRYASGEIERDEYLQKLGDL